ncbi:MAG: ATP-grasp domain-containing protein, partial [bacterium]|nr:ATP-grasp domain-containing protein [bacterium]
NIIEKQKPAGVVIQFGGQTPLKLALSLHEAGVPLLGTSAEEIDRAEDRKKFKKLIEDLQLKQPANGLASTILKARELVLELGYPVLLRPSYVLGGRAMVVVHDEKNLEECLQKAFEVSDGHPVLVDHFLKGAIEVDVDALGDGENIVVAGVMEHVEEAGIHSGDSSCCLPPHTLPREIIEEIKGQTVALGKALKVKGLMNIQFAVQKGVVYVLEVNPRASRTVPFVSKATGVAWAKLAAKILAGATVGDVVTNLPRQNLFAIKSPVFPFIKFPGVDTILSAEMCSIGEVMGRGKTFAEGFAKAQIAAGQSLPKQRGKVFLSVHDGDKPHVADLAANLSTLGYTLVCTRGTHLYLDQQGIPSTIINKITERSPHIVEALKNGEIQLVINTTIEKQQIIDSFPIRRVALEKGIPYFTNINAAQAAVQAMQYLCEGGTLTPIPL